MNRERWRFMECVLGGGEVESRKRVECEKFESLDEVNKDLLAVGQICSQVTNCKGL